MSGRTLWRVVSILPLVLLTACEQGTWLHAYRHIAQQEWTRSDTLTFITDTVAQEGQYTFEVELRASDSYPYRSLWLIVESRLLQPAFQRNDTVKCVLMDPITNRMGKGVFIYQYTVSLPPLPLQKGQYGHINIRHFMSRECLPGIRDVGIRIRY